jgi:hypothetical protein
MNLVAKPKQHGMEEQVQGRHVGLKAKYFWEEWISFQQCRLVPNNCNNSIRIDRGNLPKVGTNVILMLTSTDWCLRDHMWRFVMAGTTWLEGNYSILKGED